jgi:hypothetical protein
MCVHYCEDLKQTILCSIILVFTSLDEKKKMLVQQINNNYCCRPKQIDFMFSGWYSRLHVNIDDRRVYYDVYIPLSRITAVIYEHCILTY